MNDEDAVTHTFVCPACDEHLEVNEPMRRALIDNGCVVCRAELTTCAFTRLRTIENT